MFIELLIELVMNAGVWWKSTYQFYSPIEDFVNIESAI